MDERVPVVGRAVKAWARMHGMCNEADGFLGGYTYVVLVIFFLQTLDPCVTPSQHCFIESNSVAVPYILRICATRFNPARY